MIQPIISTPPSPSDGLEAFLNEEVEGPDPGVETRQLEVGVAHHEARLDHFLTQTLRAFSRSWLQALVRDGAVSVDGKIAGKSAQRVRVGAQVEVMLRPTPLAMAFRPEPMLLQVAYEDEHLLVVNKPAGLVVHPAAGHWSGTLLNGLLAYHAGAASLPRAGIVHRLDKDTSGLMLVAKQRGAMDRLVHAIAERVVSRRYVAMLQGGRPGLGEVTVSRWVGRDPVNRLRMAVLGEQSPGARSARTDFRWLTSSAEGALVACRLHTGRTHQIRVHAASIGHPLVGDGLYGGAARWGMSRQALHAMRLDLPHPVTGKPLGLQAMPPPDFMAAMDLAGVRYNLDQIFDANGLDSNSWVALK